MNGSRPLVIGLAVSAAVNVFLIGGLAGMAYVRLTSPPPPVVVPAPAAARPASSATSPAAPATSPPTSVETPRPTVHAPLVVEAPPPLAAPPVETFAPGALPRPPLISAADGLSPETRRAFRKALGDANKKNRPLTQQARAERQAALSALGAPGYDAAEVARRLGSARALDQQARGNVEAALAAFTASLSPQERASLADGLARVYAPAAARRAAMAEPN